jgi:hypothetical protein
MTTGAAELRKLAGDRPDLLAEVAGIAPGASESKGPEYSAKGQAVAQLCRLAGADEALIPGWIAEGRRRAEAASLPPFSRPGRTPRCLRPGLLYAGRGTPGLVPSVPGLPAMRPVTSWPGS